MCWSMGPCGRPRFSQPDRYVDDMEHRWWPRHPAAGEPTPAPDSDCFVPLVESEEASDAIADHGSSDHEQNHDHDRHIVLHQPLP
jgi:hypothetical protein